MELYLKKMIWLLTGIIFAYIAAATAATGSFQPECFYDAGEIDEIYPFTLQAEAFGLVYQNPTDDFFTITEDAAMEFLAITNKTWKYVIIDVSHLNTDFITFDLTACDESWSPLKTQRVEVKEGKTILSYELPKCKNLLLSVPDQKGTQFRFNQLQFRKKIFQHNKKHMILGGLLSLLLYIGLSLLCHYIEKEKHLDVFLPLKKAADKCFSCYLNLLAKTAVFLHQTAGSFVNSISKKVKSAARISSLSAWILAEILLRGMGMRSKVIPFHYLAAIIVMAIFTVTALEDTPRKLFWKNKLVYAWFWFSVLMTVSGIFVPKKWPGTGLLFLFSFAVFFFVWGNMKNPNIILADIAYGLKIVFWITTILSIFGRTYTAGQPYSGIYNNQNSFVSFLILLLSVNLSQICFVFQKKDFKFYKGIGLSAELCLIFFFLLETQSRGGFLAGIVVLFVFSLGFKKKLVLGIQLLILFLPVFFCTQWTILHVQKNFPARIEFTTADFRETIFEDTYGMENIVMAAESENHLISSLKAKSADALTSGRITLWKAYVRKLNLWGHYNREYTNGLSIHPHNSFLYIAYLYGIFALVPYCAMWLMIFVRAKRYTKKKLPYSFFPLILVTGFFFHSMVETFESPFAIEIWIIVYIVIGVLFHEEKSKDIIQQ